MDEKSKREMRARYMRGMEREVSFEEKRARKRRAPGRERRRAPRRREWDGDEAAFESMGGSAPRQPPARPGVDPALPRAVVAAVHRTRIVLDDGRSARVAPRLAADVELQLTVGDEVAISEREGQARIEALCPRRTVMARQDPSGIGRPLVIAANVDVGVITAAASDPPFRPGLVDRMLVALQLGAVEPALCITKVDLLDREGREGLRQKLAVYADLGLRPVECSPLTGEGVGDLGAVLRGRTAVLIGHSGVGKSSLLNSLNPEWERRTGPVRSADGRGRHTTTSSSLHDLGDGTRVIDTPGVRAFGLDALAPSDLVGGFPEFEEVGSCQFGDCTHRDEPGCAVRAAVDTGGGPISAARYRSYLRIVNDGGDG